MKTSLLEGKDYYYNNNGNFVFTAAYHLSRGICCGNGCKHCPFEYCNVSEPRKTALLAARNAKNPGFSEGA